MRLKNFNGRVTYDDNLELSKCLRALKKYNMTAYKEIIFNDRKELKSERVRGNRYKAKLTTDRRFKKVYGDVCVVFVKSKDIIKVISIEPTDFFIEAFRRLLDTYHGTPYITKTDLFKLKLYEAIGGLE